MTDAVTEPHPPPVTDLRHRIPGQAVIEQVLALQEETAPRSWWQRLLGASPLSDEARPWFKGAIGEIAVGRLLTQLGPTWTVLHAVPVGTHGTDIDHVLIGSGGVFTLNTKNHSGQPVWVAGRTLMVAGQKQHHIPRAHSEAARASKLLTTAVGEPVPVRAVLVLVSPKSLTVKQQPTGVTVLTDRQLVRWLRRRRPILTPDMITRITSVAERPGTWHNNPQPPLDPAVLQRCFTALQRSVRTARRRRQLWRAGLQLGAIIAVLAYGPRLIDVVLSAALF
ncbi:hypothetical protein GCM10011374_40150 [Kocuria dechangensis]|uniref:NERD domain-containing protein n=1 Tax=Kocuria dechangensis TaxID=1176249 RepID=A0A917M0L6_9MICC|nr:nuclease-related domain-containing protein [Kocuria dechangensis]GGG71442.1 hypothetical protein GCM10011374_40150 [Kocuria dechangensis]